MGGLSSKELVGTPRVVSSEPRTPPGTGRVDGGATLGRLQGLLDQPIDGLDTSWVQACAGAGHVRGEDL